MAIKGLSKLVSADYSAQGSKVTYTKCTVNEALVNYSASIEAGESNNFYADNGIKEIDNSVFSSGTLSIGTADLSQATTKAFFSVKTQKVTLGVDGAQVDEIIYDDETKGIQKGVGIVELHQVDGVDMYRAIVFLRVQFNIPAGAATTKGESIEWQNPTIEGAILRSDENDSAKGVHPWKREADCASEADAIKYIKKVLMDAPVAV